MCKWKFWSIILIDQLSAEISLEIAYVKTDQEEKKIEKMKKTRGWKSIDRW